MRSNVLFFSVVALAKITTAKVQVSQLVDSFERQIFALVCGSSYGSYQRALVVGWLVSVFERRAFCYCNSKRCELVGWWMGSNVAEARLVNRGKTQLASW